MCNCNGKEALGKAHCMQGATSNYVLCRAVGMEEGWEGSDVVVRKCVMGLAGLSTRSEGTEAPNKETPPTTNYFLEPSKNL